MNQPAESLSWARSSTPMDSDLVEVLQLMVQMGRVAERYLNKVRGPENVQTVALVKAEPNPPIEIPKDFSIGQAKYEDKVPTAKRWFTPKARAQMLSIYDVPSSWAYRTLQSVMRQVQTGTAVHLYDTDRMKVYAVDVLDEVGFVAVDMGVSIIVNFLPKTAREVPQIQKHPAVRTRLQAFEARIERALQR